MNNGKIGVFLLLCVSMSLTAKPFGDMSLDQIESISYNKLTPDNQNEFIKLAIFSGNINYIVPGTLAHSYAARAVLEKEFGPQDWMRLRTMLTDKGIDAVKYVLKQSTLSPQEIPLPERRPIKLEMVEDPEQALTPLPERPTTTGNGLSTSLGAPDAQTPPPLPPRPQVKQPVVQRPNPALSFSSTDLEQQKAKLKTPASSQENTKQKSFLEQALSDRFKNVNVGDAPEEEQNDDWD